ncbi:MAG: class I SAM-dependent methyltransferase [Chloroflexota bacterium]|nr:class I SAM-dependent methyltransferase [Chloroflexota bacterium]
MSLIAESAPDGDLQAAPAPPAVAACQTARMQDRTVEEAWDDRVRDEARAQWGHDPAGNVAAGDEELGSPESFALVQEHRDREQPWMAETFRWERFRGARVLEIGVGLGTDHRALARAGAVLTGIDLTPRCIELTRRRFEQEGLRSDLQVMDAENVSFADDSFDVVYSFGVLHHIPSTERAFAEVRRVLRPGGLFVGGLYSRESFFYAHVVLDWALRFAFLRQPLDHRLSAIEYSTSDARPFVRLFGREELRALLLESGFDEVAIRRRHCGLGFVTPHVPPWVERALGRIGGWYLVHEAR